MDKILRNVFTIFFGTRLLSPQSECAFTTSETEPDYYYHRVNVQVASQVAEQRKTYILGNCKITGKSLELKVHAKLAAKTENCDSCTEKLQKISFKTLHRKTYFT